MYRGGKALRVDDVAYSRLKAKLGRFEKKFPNYDCTQALEELQKPRARKSKKAEAQGMGLVGGAAAMAKTLCELKHKIKKVEDKAKAMGIELTNKSELSKMPQRKKKSTKMIMQALVPEQQLEEEMEPQIVQRKPCPNPKGRKKAWSAREAYMHVHKITPNDWKIDKDYYATDLKENKTEYDAIAKELTAECYKTWLMH